MYKVEEVIRLVKDLNGLRWIAYDSNNKNWCTNYYTVGRQIHEA